MIKKEFIQLLELKDVKEVEILDTWGSYRDAVIYYVDGEEKHTTLDYRSEYAVKKYMENKNIRYSN